MFFSRSVSFLMVLGWKITPLSNMWYWITIACNICKNDSKFNATVCKLLHNELLRLVLHEKMKNLSLQPHLELFGVENHPFVQYVVLLDNVYFIITNISAVSKPFAYCFVGHIFKKTLKTKLFYVNMQIRGDFSPLCPEQT